ncbi:MAG: ABC transporter permease [Aggregatilineales bacterium]
MIQALVQKDIKLFFRNQFFALITGLSLVIYIALYFVLPDSVNQSLSFALYTDASDMSEVFNGNGLEAVSFDSQEALIAAVENGDYSSGLVLPSAMVDSRTQGEQITLQVYYAPDTTTEEREAINSVFSAKASGLVAPDVTTARINRVTEVLGRFTEAPIPLRDRMVPTLVLLIFTVEVMGMATLIVEEIEHGTARAVLITPLGLPQFFTSKALMGIGLAFVQVFIVVAITGNLATSPLIMIATLLVGSLLITGIGFLIASVARDMMSVMAWGMLILVVLTLPAITIILPTIGAGWIDLIPTYFLVDTLHQTMNFGASWVDVTSNLLILLITGGIAILLGSVLLRRRFS